MKRESLNQLREKNALSFMMYAYFGIANADNRFDVINASINRAYRDAASHVLSFKNEEDKKSAKKQAKEKIDTAINQLKNCQDNYDKWHECLCDDLIGIYKKYNFNDGYEFTYGIAQKWVNMTMKYLYVIYYFYSACGYYDSDFQLEFGQMIRRYAFDFHVPIDRVITEAAKNDFGISGNFKNWSKINTYDDYYSFEKAIKNHSSFDHDACSAIRYSPIDWEGHAWIDTIMK